MPFGVFRDFLPKGTMLLFYVDLYSGVFWRTNDIATCFTELVHMAISHITIIAELHKRACLKSSSDSTTTLSFSLSLSLSFFLFQILT